MKILNISTCIRNRTKNFNLINIVNPSITISLMFSESDAFMPIDV